MRDAVTDLMVFIGDQKIGRMPRAYFLLDNMRNNIEIFIITSGEQEQDFIQLMNVLFRDWWAANDEWDDVTEAGSMESIRLRNFGITEACGSVFSVERQILRIEAGGKTPFLIYITDEAKSGACRAASDCYKIFKAG